MNRREFLKRGGIGSIALASVPALAHRLAKPAQAYEVTNFHGVARSKAATVGGVDHRVAISADGRVFAHQVEGGGVFLHFDAAPPAPKPVLATGTWTARQVVAFDLIGTWGVFAAGVLEMLVDLFPDGAPAIKGARLKFVCNLGAVPLQTGLPEGMFLSIPRAPFGEFAPLIPEEGLTVFSTAWEERVA